MNETIDDIIQGDSQGADTSVAGSQYLQDANGMEDVGTPTPWYMAESPDVPVEDYITHPLNYDESVALARVIRGCEGLLGGLRYALVDVIVGALQYAREVSDVD